MSEQTAQEPTMEEILASIRRIISEDDAPAAEAAPAPAPAPEPEPAPAPVEVSPALMDETPSHEEDDVLELTQRYDEPAPEPIQTLGDLDVTARYDPPAPAPEPEPIYRPEPTPAYDEGPVDSLISDRTADISASAFAGLASSILMPSAGRSLEDLVKELMKPMLRDWLDKNLPAIVEAQVRIAVEDVARRATAR